MPKVAIVQKCAANDSDDYYSEVVYNSITEWTEISEEDYILLRRWIHELDKKHWLQSYSLLLKPENQTEIIIKAVDQCVELARKDQEEAEERRRKYAEAKAAKEAKKIAKNAKAKLELYEKLKRELEDARPATLD